MRTLGTRKELHWYNKQLTCFRAGSRNAIINIILVIVPLGLQGLPWHTHV